MVVSARDKLWAWIQGEEDGGDIRNTVADGGRVIRFVLLCCDAEKQATDSCCGSKHFILKIILKSFPEFTNNCLKRLLLCVMRILNALDFRVCLDLSIRNLKQSELRLMLMVLYFRFVRGVEVRGYWERIPRWLDVCWCLFGIFWEWGRPALVSPQQGAFLSIHCSLEHGAMLLQPPHRTRQPRYTNCPSLLIFEPASRFHVYLLWVNTHLKDS